jgi:APA family basic amino acid/polyamine antiporter
MYSLGAANWIRLFVWLIIGLCVYFTYSLKHSKVQKLPAVQPQQAD